MKVEQEEGEGSYLVSGERELAEESLNEAWGPSSPEYFPSQTGSIGCPF